MNKPKAIEILTLMGTPEFKGHTEDILAARKLGIEALKAIGLWNQYQMPQHQIHLPGETLD